MACAYDFPAVEVDVVFVFILVASDIKTDRDFLILLEVVEPCAFVFDQFEFNVLRVVFITNGENEFTFGESAWEGLSIENDFEFSSSVVHD